MPATKWWAPDRHRCDRSGPGKENVEHLRILLANLGTEGDTAPIIALASGLIAAGHQAVIACDGAYTEAAERAGIELRILSVPDAMRWEPGTTAFDAFERGRYAMSSLPGLIVPDRAWLEELTDAAKGADLVLGGPIIYHHAMSVARSLGIPGVLAHLQPMSPSREHFPTGVGRVRRSPWANLAGGHLIRTGHWAMTSHGLNRARHELGLPRTGNPTRHVPALGAWSPTLSPAPRDWGPEVCRVVGQWRNKTPDFVPDEELTGFLAAGEAPIYVGFGSMPAVNWLPRLRRTLLDALRGRRILLSAGWAGLDDEPLPGNVLPIGHVPHDWLFPRCAAVIHHCGAGTSHAAARAGTPTIPLPFALDQPFWAHRLHRLGVASRPLDPRRATTSDINAAVREIETDSMAMICTKVARAMAAENGVGSTIPILEQLAREEIPCQS